MGGWQMEENLRDGAPLSPNWAEIVRLYNEMMDEVMPYLPLAEQIVYQRLFRLSYVQGKDFATGRYLELAHQCRLSLSTLQRAIRGLKGKRLLKTAWYSHGATTFHVRLLSHFPHRPSFLPRKRRDPFLSSRLPVPSRPPVYDAFSPEDRELFLSCKRSLSPQRLSEITEEAAQWLSERGEEYSEEDLRDKIDELILREVFGQERQHKYEPLFSSLYQQSTDEL